MERERERGKEGEREKNCIVMDGCMLMNKSPKGEKKEKEKKEKEKKSETCYSLEVKSAITKMFSHYMKSLFESAFTRNDRKSHLTHRARLQLYDCSDEVSNQRK
ncbi:MAG: hypothetical protein LGB70_03485 [Sulfurovum sp.]|nr:hypothetical protein [Sulfurovum sp.]